MEIKKEQPQPLIGKARIHSSRLPPTYGMISNKYTLGGQERIGRHPNSRKISLPSQYPSLQRSSTQSRQNSLVDNQQSNQSHNRSQANSSQRERPFRIGRHFEKENSFNINQLPILEESGSLEKTMKEMFINGDKFGIKNQKYKQPLNQYNQQQQQIYMSLQQQQQQMQPQQCKTPTCIQSRALEPIQFDQNIPRKEQAVIEQQNVSVNFQRNRNNSNSAIFKHQQFKKNYVKKLNSFNVYLPPPQVTAKCWAVFDASKMNFIHGKREYMRREVASLTKMMTAYTVIKLVKEYKIDMSKEMVVIQQVAAQISGTTACLQEADQLTVEQLLYGLMLPSGNDAAFALAQHFGQILFNSNYESLEEGNKVYSYQFNWHGYYVKYFLREMNENAARIQMMSTNFDSPHGLMNQQNYSTAYDIAKLASKCMQNDLYRKIVNTKIFECQGRTKDGQLRKYCWENTNKLLGQDGFNGIKTGITDSAGPCLASSYQKGPDFFIVVILNSKSMEQRWVEVPKLVEWAITKKNAQIEMSKQYDLGNTDSNHSLVSQKLNLR